MAMRLRYPLMVLLVFSCLMQVFPKAFAQNRATGGGVVEPIELNAHRRFSRGQLDACEITYLIAFQDNIYKQGGVSALRGAVSLMGFSEAKDKPPALLLKVTAFDIVGENPVFSPLEVAYLSANGKSYAGKEFTKFTCEDGGLCVGYNLFEHAPLAIDISSGFEINILRANGNSDIAIPINIGSISRSVLEDYSKCTLDLLDVVERKVSK